MFLISFLKGLFVGLVISLPTGPVGFLSVKRTVNDGFASGFVTGLGVVLSDLVYSIIIIIGLSSTSQFFINYKIPIHIIGGTLLIVLGILTYFSKKQEKRYNTNQLQIQTRFGQFVSAFLVTMLNPFQIITFTALLGSLSVFHNFGNLSVLFLLGLLLGSLVWWTALAFFVTKIRSSFNESHIKLINHISGVVITFSGVFILIHLFLV
jgi:threonine/homoserine/homoserine lactone efflux protein